MAFYLSGGHRETLKAAADVLRSGGNAFDAAIAAYATSFVTEPAMSSAGGGGFALCSKNNEPLRAFDFFSSTPRQKPRDASINIQPVEVHFGEEKEIYYTDMGSIAIPGAVRGIFSIHRAYGSMPITELFHHAIQLAKNGVELNDFQHLDLNLLKNIFIRSAYAKSIFFDEKENIKKVGSSISIPEMSDFLEVLALEGEDLFYRGEVGKQLIVDCKENGGLIDEVGLAAYKARICKPVATNYGSQTLHTMPYPSLGGQLLIWLTQQQQTKNWSDGFRSNQYMANMEELLTKARNLQNNPQTLFSLFNLEFPNGDNRRGSTSHFNILDKQQNAVSMTMTIGEGSGYFIPGTGIHMNNMLGEPGLLPNGINSWKPDTPMRSMMSPTIVTDAEGNPEILLGSGGAVRIPFMLAEVLQHVLGEGCELDKAIDRPRLFYDDEILQIEASSQDLDAYSSNLKCNHWSEKSLFFGGVHGIYKQPNAAGFVAYGDRRRDGVEWVE